MVWHVCDEYTVDPPLPKGLQLDKVTGNLYGKAEIHFPASEFVIRGRSRVFDNAAGKEGNGWVLSNILTLECQAPRAPSDLSYKDTAHDVLEAQYGYFGGV